MRYHLSVHDVHKTHLDKLDSPAKHYLKKWLNMPSRGASDIAIFHPYLLNIKTPSQLYKEGHTGNYALMRIKGDTTVNLALDSRLERESNWRGKYSTIVASEEVIQDNISNDKFFIPTSNNTFDIEISRSSEIEKAKKSVKVSIQEETLSIWNSKVEKLTMQGDFAKLLIEEKENVTWQYIIRNVSIVIMSFALGSVANCLTAPVSLKRWGKRNISKCPLCSKNGTLEHILYFCSIS